MRQWTKRKDFCTHQKKIKHWITESGVLYLLLKAKLFIYQKIVCTWIMISEKEREKNLQINFYCTRTLCLYRKLFFSWFPSEIFILIFFSSFFFFFNKILPHSTYWFESSCTINCWPHIDNIGSTIPCLHLVWKLYMNNNTNNITTNTRNILIWFFFKKKF